MKAQKMNGAPFTVSDLNLAAYLLATDHPLLRLEGPAGRRNFVFDNVNPEAVTSFYAGARVEARKLLGALRDLKGLVAQEGRR